MSNTISSYSPSYDRLHPTKKKPTALYVDKGYWKTKIKYTPTFFPFLVSNQKNHHKPFQNRDALCSYEVKRRFPNKQFTKRKKAKLKQQIVFSTINRQDLKCSTHFSKKIRRKLHIEKEKLCQTSHHFFYNSPLRGHKYYEKPKPKKCVTLKTAISSSSDRTSDRLHMGRVALDAKGKSICYTGRPDTLQKAEEQAKMIFLNEIHSTKQGIVKKKDAAGKKIYHLNYTVVSLLKSAFFFKKIPYLSSYPERTYLENERKALQTLKAKTIKVKDPQTKKTYHFRVNPILFSNQFNFMHSIEKVLPAFLSGKLRTQEINMKGHRELMSAMSNKKKKKQIKFLLDTLKKNQNSLLPEEELLLREQIFHLLKLPRVYHCKSSKDRTNLAVAIASALSTWRHLKRKIPKDVISLLQNKYFKELIAANAMIGHQISRYALAAEGKINGKKLNSKGIGLTLGKGITQNPLVHRLFPKRYLTSFSVKKHLLNSFRKHPVRNSLIAMGAIVLIPTVIVPLLAITGFLSTLLSPLAGPNCPHYIRPFLFLTPFLFAYRLLPKKILNDASPLVGARQLIGSNPN